MSVAAAQRRPGYSPSPMTSTAANHAKRPWASAIDYWLRELKLTQAEVVRRINAAIDGLNAANAELARMDGKRRKRIPRFGANTMSRIARGHHTHTRKLELIAEHLPVPFEDLLVSPLRRGATSDNRRLREIVHASLENLLRSVDVGGVQVDTRTLRLAQRLDQLPDDLRQSVERVIVEYEQIVKKRRRSGGARRRQTT